MRRTIPVQTRRKNAYALSFESSEAGGAKIEDDVTDIGIGIVGGEPVVALNGGFKGIARSVEIDCGL